MISIITDNRYLLHDSGVGHPERPERITACNDALKTSDILDKLQWLSPRVAEISDILRAHTTKHIQQIKEVCETGGGYLDPDTHAGYESYEIALLSAGAWLDGVDEVLSGKSAVVISRPPGHHAENDNAMGFCLFNNCAIASLYTVEEKNIERIAIFDWDAHHGNGVQHILEGDERFLYCSMHQSPHYPGTGRACETGKYNNVLNIPLSANTGSNEYLSQFHNEVMPFIRNFEPQLLIVSAGFDAHEKDPLCGLNLQSRDFGEMTKALIEINPQILFGLEGGYDLSALGECVVEVCRNLI
ncbi:MAG: histone deacetylase [Candidatus Marinimicrobia bacterium]|nr:histone deacetylase [Candidatus Neomarinimicrobiota bacterium]MBL7022925.1 histone deacetylase [Candidatus Neomarinimicrobiota bacterium]MBL7108743.1 histone deacetylase [Candidatus Neomarinimicrobiota bacterium]